MDPHIFIARAEAQRWLGIAEKLLMSHDLVGSKTFAIRARESDPRLEAADQILAVVDTLIAAEKQVVGNNGVQQPDFYAILQLVRFVQDTDHIASQYQRLAFILNPHQNRFPYSDQAFQIVNEAWSVLSNPMRKSMYDSELDFAPQLQMNTIGFNLEEQHQQQQQQEQHNFFSIDYMGSDHQQKSPEQEQTFQTRVQRTRQQQESQQHNFLSRNQSAPAHEEDEQLFQHHEQEQLFQPQVEPLEVMSTPYQQNPPQSHQPQPSMQSTTPPPPAVPPQPPLSWPQAPSLSQRQQPHQKQQPPLQPQQQEAWAEQNAGPVQSPNQVNSNNGAKEKETETETEAEAVNVDESPTFWTACPYCFYMYEYQRIYAECTIRCDNCKRAFQAVSISSPPLMAEGKEDYFYCWGYFPLGVSISHLPKTARTNSKWTPFSPLHDASSNVQNHLNSREAPKKNTFVKKDLGPRIYIDDITDDIFTGISEPSDDSDVEWNMTRDKS